MNIFFSVLQYNIVYPHGKLQKRAWLCIQLSSTLVVQQGFETNGNDVAWKRMNHEEEETPV